MAVGAAEAEREATGRREVQVIRAINERDTAETRAALGEAAFAAAWAEGRAMTLEQAVAYALDEPRPRGSAARDGCARVPAP